MSVPRAIEDFLKNSGCTYSAFTHAAAYTAQEETAAAHVPGREWAKTVVCFADDEPILAVLPAVYAVDVDRLRELAGAQTLRLAHEEEFAALYPDSEAGAMPPLGPLYGQRVFVDTSLTENPVIVFHAGTHADAVRMPYEEFERLVHPRTGQFAR